MPRCVQGHSAVVQLCEVPEPVGGDDDDPPRPTEKTRSECVCVCVEMSAICVDGNENGL